MGEQGWSRGEVTLLGTSEKKEEEIGTVKESNRTLEGPQTVEGPVKRAQGPECGGSPVWCGGGEGS